MDALIRMTILSISIACIAFAGVNSAMAVTTTVSWTDYEQQSTLTFTVDSNNPYYATITSVTGTLSSYMSGMGFGQGTVFDALGYWGDPNSEFVYQYGGSSYNFMFQGGNMGYGNYVYVDNGYSASGNSTSNAPEPITCVSMGIVAGVLAFSRRRKGLKKM